MNKKDFNQAWYDMPVLRPAFVMTKDVDRMSGMVTYKKGTLLYGTGSDNSFWGVTDDDRGGVSLPISSVKFLGYVNIKTDGYINSPEAYDDIIKQMVELENV